MDEEKSVLVGAVQAVETREVRGAIMGFIGLGILNFIALCAYIFGADAWRQRFADDQIWVLWTPYWLWVGIFLLVAHTLFLYTLLILVRNPMRTAFIAISVIMFVIFIGGGAVFWGVELALYCYGNQETFCYDTIAGGLWWNVWWAFGAYWAEVIILLIMTIIVGNTFDHESLRQLSAPYEAKITPVQVPASQLKESKPMLVLGIGSLASAMLGMKAQAKDE